MPIKGCVTTFCVTTRISRIYGQESAISSERDSASRVRGGRVVYVGSLDHNVYVLNATTGAKMWSYRTGGAVESSPVVDFDNDNIVYVGG